LRLHRLRKGGERASEPTSGGSAGRRALAAVKVAVKTVDTNLVVRLVTWDDPEQAERVREHFEEVRAV
jgi:hypothetical protein